MAGGGAIGGGERSIKEQMSTPLMQERKELIERKMPKPLSDEELLSLTPEKLYEWFGQAVVSMSEMVDDLDHRISPMGTIKNQEVTFDVRAAIPGHSFWVERTANGRVW